MWLILILVGLCVYFIYDLIQFWIIKPWHVHRALSLQGVRGRHTPIVGDILRIRQAIRAEKPLSYSIDASKEFGDYYRMSLGPIPGFNISDPSLIVGVLKTNAHCYRKSIFMQSIIGTLIGTDNLLISENVVHAQCRRLLSPVFQHQNLNSMIPMMIEITSNVLNKWAQCINKNENRMTTIDVREEMSLLTLSMISGCVFGKNISKDKDIHEKMYRNVTVILNEIEKRLFDMTAILPLINRLPFPSKLRIDKSMQDLRTIVESIIDERKKGLTRSTAKGPDLLDQLLTRHDHDQTNQAAVEKIYEEALTFIIAGHETTSNLMAWTLYNLACHPEVYRHCQNEIDSVLNNEDAIDSSTISLLHYTEAVLKESLRLYPSIPLLPRTAIEDNTLVTHDGKHIRISKGTEVIVNLYMLHHSENYWLDPEKFDPSRFDQHQADNFLPFSIGFRSCIGQHFAMLEAKIMLSMILRRFHIELVPGQKHVPDIAITLRPKYAMWIRVSLRAIYGWYNFFGYVSTALGALSSGYFISKLTENYQFHAATAYQSILIAYAIFGAVKTVIYLCLSRQIETTLSSDSESIILATDSSSQGAAKKLSTHIFHWFNEKFGLRRPTSRRTVAKLCCLFIIDAIGGGFVMQSMIIYWFHERFQMNIEMLVGRIGAINTMVITHIPSNIFLILIPFMRTKTSAVAMLLLRFSISQMDVPARQTFVAISVDNNERSAAGGITNLVRSVGLSISPMIVGYLLQDSQKTVLFALPFVIGGGLKLFYDILLYVSFDVSNRNQSTYVKDARINHGIKKNNQNI
ncbi:unnamed protein product [Rotaria sp. Silwood1]|nr:unnamed protein product [Rotaria sp. Silwood1]